MADAESIPTDIKRLILRSIDSVPHLEVLLLLHRGPQMKWNAKIVSQGLFIEEKKVEKALQDLSAAGFASVKDEPVPSYRYNPATPALKEMIDRLAEIYPKNLIEITNLIHSKLNKQAQQFGDAFKWKNEKE